MKLLNYFRSSASYRVRIALNLKHLEYEYIPVSLLKGEQETVQFKDHNPQGFVPVLMDNDIRISQSMAICEYLEEVYPYPALLPNSLAERACVRSLALSIACDIHPLNNLSVLNYLKDDLGQDEHQRKKWYQHWITRGFSALEIQLTKSAYTQTFCHGDTPGLIDVFLIPQVTNALRYECPLERYPTIQRIYTTCLKLPAFEQAKPENQPDAPKI